MKYHFFSNRGGVSRGRYSSLNVGLSVGDDPLSIETNRSRVKKRFGEIVLVSACQVHKDRIFVVDGVPEEDMEVDGFDALITGSPGVALMVQLADCQGVLLYDYEKSAIAAIHCGWRGSVAGIIGKSVQTLQDCFGSSPAAINAYISPSLGPCCAEFVNYQAELPDNFHSFQVKPNYFNFWDISKSQLIEAGVNESNIVISKICTSCSKDYFSYRRACRTGDPLTGRHCGVICLE